MGLMAWVPFYVVLVTMAPIVEMRFPRHCSSSEAQKKVICRETSPHDTGEEKHQSGHILMRFLETGKEPRAHRQLGPQ